MGGSVGTTAIATDSETGRIVGTTGVGGCKPTIDKVFVYSPEGELYFERNITSLIGSLKPYCETQTDMHYEVHGVAINNNLIFIPNRNSRIVYVFTFNAELVSAFRISGKELIFDDKTENVKSTRLVVDDDGIFICRNRYVLALIHEIKPQLFEIVKEENGHTSDILLHDNNLHILSYQKSMPTITILSKNGISISTYQFTQTSLQPFLTFTLDNKGQYYFCTHYSVLKYNGETLSQTQTWPDDFEDTEYLPFEKKIAMDHSGQRLISINTTNYPELSINFLTLT